MKELTYTSNLSPLWPFERQEDALRTALPGWPKGIETFRDELIAKDRRRHQTEFLTQRKVMLRPTTRSSPGRVTVASLAVLAWTEPDMLDVLAAAAKRGLFVRALDAGLEIGPASGPVDMQRAAEAFRAGRKRDAAVKRGEMGGRVSGDARKAEAKAKAETIRAEWALPSEDYPTLALLERAGISRNTAKLYLGSRAVAQRNHQAALKRRARKEQAQ